MTNLKGILSESPSLGGSLAPDGNLSGNLNGLAGGSGNVYSEEITTIKVLDLSEYEEIPVKDPKTLYFIRG